MWLDLYSAIGDVFSVFCMTNSELHNNAEVQELFETAKKCIVIFGVASAVLLSILVANAVTQSAVSTFMWVRAGIMLALSPVLHSLAVRASRGSRVSLDRLKTVTTILPVAIVVVDLIPGVCPVWYAAMQGCSALPLIAVAVITRRRALRAAFPVTA